MRGIIFILFTALFMSGLFLAGCGIENIWGENYTVTFDANGGKYTDNTTVQTIQHNPNNAYAAIVPDCSYTEFILFSSCMKLPVMENNLFYTWNTKPDGTGKSYIISFVSMSDLPNKDITLYAQWHPKSAGYTLVFLTDFAPNIPHIAGIPANTTVTLPQNITYTNQHGTFALSHWEDTCIRSSNQVIYTDNYTTPDDWLRRDIYMYSRWDYVGQ